jgi:ribosome-associated protein
MIGNETEPDINQQEQNSDFIRLDQFLKLNNLVRSGGEAKHLIQNGNVKVNGQVETRRGKKLRQGDVVEAFGQKIRIETSSF